MLFPAAALDDPQRQKEKEQSERQEHNDRPGIHNPAGEIAHMLEQRNVGQGLGLPAILLRQLAGEHTQQEQAGAKQKTDHGSSHLAAGDRRSATAGRDKQTAEEQNADKSASNGA